MFRILPVLIIFICIGGFIYFSNKRPYLSLEESDLFLSRPNFRVLITHKGGIGEHEMAERIKIAGKSLNLECANFPLHQSSIIKRIFPHYRERFATLFHPDLVISLQGDKIFYPHAKHYVALTHGSNYYFTANSILPAHHLTDFDAYLICFPDQEKLFSYCNFVEKESPHITWYTTCGKTDFSPPSHFQLFYCGFNMATTHEGTKFKHLFSRLDKTHYFNVYGKKEEWRHTPNCYRGFIKSDGLSLLKTMNNRGVTLIFHDADHFLGRTPTARIFEAAAASTVIISDRHPFIEKNFGDAVLYIDHEKSAEELFQQIDRHMKWIKNNPEESLLLAKKAHAIFIEKFTLEAQLENLINLHKSLFTANPKEKPEAVIY
jgi:hypothetical protein